MLGNTRLAKQFRNVIKVLGVAIAVYLALTIKTGFTGETNEVTQFDYLENEIKTGEQSENIDEEDHGASSAFNKLCSKYKYICDKISRAGNFTDKDKSRKFAYVAYLLMKLDNNISRGKNPSDALLAMLINENSGSRRGSANRTTITINYDEGNMIMNFFK